MKKKIVLLMLLIVSLMLVSCSCSGDELAPGEMSATLNSSGKKLTVEIMPDADLLEKYPKETLYLFGLEPGESAPSDLAGKTPLDEKKANDKVKFKLPLEENGENRLYHYFVAAFYDSAAREYVLATDRGVYIKNPQVLADNKNDFPVSYSIKGINAKYDTDALALGVSHVIIDLPIEEYVLADGADDAFSYTFMKNTRFVDRKAIEKLDSRVKYFTSNGVAVYFRFTLKTAESALPDELKCLAYPGSTEGEAFYALNTRNEKGAELISGFADFIAERYCSHEKDAPYGQAVAFIAGNALNTPGASVGTLEYSAYFEDAARLVRILYTAMASHFENGRVFVTVDHRWKAASGGTADSGGFKFLTEFATAAKKEGDYPWGVALATKATSTDTDRIWYDNSGDGSYLTPSNLGALTSIFLEDPKYLYGDETRNVIISDFAIELSATDSAELNQAASYAYAYYKAVATEKISAFFYSNQIDTEKSASGLRRVTEDKLPGSARQIYSIMKNIDTTEDISATVNRATSSDGGWTSVYAAYSETVMRKVSTSGNGKAVEGTKDAPPEDAYKASPLFSFVSGDMNGFSYAGNGTFAGVTDGGLLVRYANPSSAEPGYVYKTEIKKSEIKDDSLLICLGDLSESSDVTLTLIQKNGKNPDVIYESKVSGVPSGGAVLIDFDISEFRDELRSGKIELRISATGKAGLPVKVQITDILIGKAKTNTALIVILIILASVAIVTIGALGVMWFRKNYTIEIDRTPKKEKKKTPKKQKNGAETD